MQPEEGVELIKDTDLIAKLSTLGCQLTGRGISDWIRKGLLPRRERVGRGQGKGRGAVYAWNDGEILLRAYTVYAALGLHWRTDIAMLLTWFTGFDYPIERMRRLWAAFERRRRNQPFIEATGADSLEESELHDMLGVLRGYLLSFRVAQKMPSGSLDIFLGFLDPKYDPRKMTDDQARDLLRHFISRMKMDSGLKAILEFVRPELVRECAVFLYEYFSPGKLPLLIETTSEQEMKVIHDDWRFLAGPHRWALRVAMEGAGRGSEHHHNFLYMLTRLGWRLGRTTMLIDLALRRSGHEDRVEQSIAELRKFADRDDIWEAVAALDTAYQGTNQAVGSWWKEGQNQNVWHEEFIRRMEPYEHLSERAATATELLNSLWDLWRPVIEPVISGVFASPETSNSSADGRRTTLEPATLQAQ